MTHKIKLFTVYDHYIRGHDYYGDDDYSIEKLGEGIIDWEEVTDEELKFLRENLHYLKVERDQNSVIVEQSTRTVPEVIVGINKTIAALQRKQAEKEEAERKKREEAAAVRQAKKLERDRKALTKLIEMNPELVKELKLP